MIKKPGELDYICLPQDNITSSCLFFASTLQQSGILKASGLRPR
jgi:hypothetical protein